MSESNESKVVRFVQILLLEIEDKSLITPALITEKLEIALKLNSKWSEGLNREEVIDELIRRFSIWIGADSSLQDNTGHEPWLDSARKKDWRYWQRYREMIERELSWDIADKLDISTDKILALLEDPTRQGTWSRRGLVVGHVQSGKTASYTGLICKAADAQYKVIIVLAGLHNNLRSQTQIRLEQGFLGYETNADNESLKLTGVGLIDSDISIKPNCATTRSEKGDFGGRAANQLSISPEQRPWLFVVKKNKTVLVRLLKWIQNHVADTSITLDNFDTTGNNTKIPVVKKRVTKFPLLIIDDEADNASVDTGENIVNEYGEKDEDHDPKTINKLIRRILHSFSRSAYVGYTATPFANIFIHERGETRNEGPDLFPSSFIQNLAAPSNYIGPSKVFGYPTTDGRKNGLPLIKEVIDFKSNDGLNGWMPVKHKIVHIPRWSPSEALPPSLKEAIDSFVLACAIRLLRGQNNEHCSMLIHVTRFNQVQIQVEHDVREYVDNLRRPIYRKVEHEEILSRLYSLWINDFLPTTDTIRKVMPDALPQSNPSWEDIVNTLPNILSDIDVRTINGSIKDTLDYEQSKEKGIKVIAIGGDKLARGLTLEGLCTSYFLRASKMYDTLMQMGRWFGYRPGYLDLCRLYTSPDLVEWFEHISDAAAELREEFEMMANLGATPTDFGLKIKSHPELMVTSQIKMRSAKTLLLSYSGQLMQTVSFPRDRVDLANNFDITRRLIVDLGPPSTNGKKIVKNFGSKSLSWSGVLWRNVQAQLIIDFLRVYKTSSIAHRVNGPVLSEFIEKMSTIGELTEWSVAFIGKESGTSLEITDDIKINKVCREITTSDDDRFSIGVLLDPTDESIDLEENQWHAALDLTIETWQNKKEKKATKQPETPYGPSIRRIKGLGANNVDAHPEKGLLVLYAIEPTKEKKPLLADDLTVIGFGISFPGSKTDVKVEYKINNVGWEQDYGASE